MYRDVWNVCRDSVCSISFYDDNGIAITSVTGFKANNLLITDDSIFGAEQAKRVLLRFVGDDGYSPNVQIDLDYGDFISCIRTGGRTVTTSFAVLEIADPQFANVPSLTLSTEARLPIGLPVALMGFQFDQPNLTLKSGILSSNTIQPNNFRYYQFDVSTKRGNSGSPLINAETKEVVGVIGYKLAQKNRAFNQMLDIVRNNIDVLRGAEGKFNVGDIDPIQVLIASQNQIKQLSTEIFKGTGFSTGYALDISYVTEFLRTSCVLRSAIPVD